MSSSNQSVDISRTLSDLTKEIRKMSGTGPTRAHTGGARKSDDAIDPKSIKETNKSLKETHDALDKMNKGLNMTNASFKELHDAHTDAIKGVVNTTKGNVVANKLLVDWINKNVKAHTFLGEALSHTTKTAADLEKRLEQTGDYLAEYSEAVSKASSASLSSISDAGELKKALDNLNKQITLSADIQEMIAKGQYDAAAKALDDEAKTAHMIRDSARKTSLQFGLLAGAAGSLGKGMSKALDHIGHSWIKEAVELSGASALVIEGVKETYQQFWETAGKGFGGAFLKLSGSAISLGISLDSLSTITKQNMNLVGKMGLEGFTNSLKATQSSLMQLGLSTEEAAKTSAILTQNAFLTGVDLKNKKAVNEAQQTQIKQYSELRSTTGESIEVLAEQTKSILESNDTTKAMLGMDKQQRALMVQNINAERIRLTTMGLTNEATQDYIKTMQSMGAEKADDRVSASNKILSAGAVMGIDADTTAAASRARLMTDAQRAADPTAQADYDKFTRAMAAKNGQMNGVGSNLATQKTADIGFGMLATEDQQQVTTMQGAATGTRGLTEEQKKSNAALGKVPKAIADTSARVEEATKALESPLAKIVAGVAGILAILAWNKYKKNAIEKLEKGAARHAGREAAEIGEEGRSIQGSRIAGSESGFGKMSRSADELAFQGNKKYMPMDKETRAFRSGRYSELNTSIGSSRLQDLAARQRVRGVRSKRIPNFLSKLGMPEKGPITEFGGKVGGMLGKGASKIGGVLGKGASKLAGMGASALELGSEAIPVVGEIVAAIGGIYGAFQGVEHAATIFGVDTKKEAVTTSEKVSAGIAGALSTISMGLIPEDGLARYLNDVATNGAGVIADTIESGFEWVYNTAIPGIWSGLKAVVGGVGGAIIHGLNPMVWIRALTGVGGGGDGSVVGTILQYIREASEFMVVALVKGVAEIGASFLAKIISMLPSWMVPDSVKKASASATAWAASDTKFSDFDTKQEADARSKRSEAKKKRDAANDKTSEDDSNSVQGTTPDADTSNLGIGNTFGQPLSEDQLAAQGVVLGSSPTQSTPGVDASNGGTSNSPGTNDTTVTNSPNSASSASPPKSETQSLLEEIRDGMNKLVDLTSKGLTITKDDSKKNSTAKTMAQTNFQVPTIADFLNYPV